MSTRKATVEETPDLKPGLGSTTFWGKCVLQGLTIINAILKASGKPALNITPEISAAITFFLEVSYMSWRHYNRSIVNKGIIEVQVEKAKERTKVEESKSKAIVATAKAKPKRGKRS